MILDSLDTTVDPCQDFYSFACGGWLNKTKIPKTKSSYGSFNSLNDELLKTLKGILEGIPIVKGKHQNVTDKAAVAYHACKSVTKVCDRIDVVYDIMNASALGDWPITKTSISDIKNLTNCSDLLLRTGFGPILRYDIGRDSKNLTNYVIQIDQMTFPVVGRNQLIHPNKTENKRIMKAYKRLVEATLAFMTFSINLLNWEFSKADILLTEDETVELYSMDYYKKLVDFLESTKPALLFNYIGLRIMFLWAPHASRDIRDALFGVKKATSGIQEMPPRWKECTNLINSAMMEVTGYLYVKEKFSPEAKSEVEDLVSRLKDIFKSSLEQNQWMDNETKEKALLKLNQMESKIAYPKWGLNMTFLEELYHYEYFKVYSTSTDFHGSQFDANGRLEQWWTNETRKKFDKRALCFKHQYGSITVKRLNMTVWCNKAREGYLRELIQYDPHTPNRYRQGNI
ncbi:hypothetical protein HPB52_014450 [Rhipicephalus sanguineus]|uniref:Peptidase M13 N-terminal domain-containing protein n=1 Tax=Rhipicephalus sanguineus TaxID=34632 RepID=A0A9D4SNN9_RHISA|nr:hypothetical protein HPB52_014450 [Rhipicephalus sanguineus]